MSETVWESFETDTQGIQWNPNVYSSWNMVGNLSNLCQVFESLE